MLRPVGWRAPQERVGLSRLGALCVDPGPGRLRLWGTSDRSAICRGPQRCLEHRGSWVYNLGLTNTKSKVFLLGKKKNE